MLEITRTLCTSLACNLTHSIYARDHLTKNTGFMEELYVPVALACGVLTSLHVWKFFNWAWLEPRRKEKWLRQMGFNGNKYRFLIGDYREIRTKNEEVISKPISFSNDILDRTMSLLHQSYQDYGGNCFIWFGTKPMVLITDPEMIKEILSRNYVFQKVKTPLDKLLAGGVAVYEKDKWAKHRRLINPAFHLEKLKLMLPLFYLSCGDMLSKWDNIVPNNGGSSEVDVWPYLEILTSDAISRTAFGSSYEEGRKVFQLQKELGVLLLQSFKSLLIPGWRFLPTKENRRMKEIGRQVESSILEIIHKRMHLIEAGEEAGFDDLLGILLESNFREIQENGNESGMNFGDVVAECKLFYLAGQTTTASLLVWTMILLGKHLDWQARAREEVLQVLSTDKLPDFQELNHLKVINMIILEVLRLYPSVVMLSRAVYEETTVGNITLPAGTWLFLPVILLHHDRNLWGEDAKEFKPERFSEGVSKATKGQFSYLPFGSGPRICIDQNFAMLEAKMALAMILWRYSFEVSPSYAHAPESVLSLLPQHGAQLNLQRI